MEGAGTLSCLEGYGSGGCGVTTIGGDTDGVIPGEGVTFGSDTGLGALDEGLLASGIVGESTLGSGAGGTLSFFCRNFVQEVVVRVMKRVLVVPVLDCN
eukprot:3969310-Ditylum_brightwellii.AAC.1